MRQRAQINEALGYIKNNPAVFGALSTKIDELRLKIMNRKRAPKEDKNIKLTQRECNLILSAIALSMDRALGNGGDYVPPIGAEVLSELGRRDLDI
jgi:hypothetical protein